MPSPKRDKISRTEKIRERGTQERGGRRDIQERGVQKREGIPERSGPLS